MKNINYTLEKTVSKPFFLILDTTRYILVSGDVWGRMLDIIHAVDLEDLIMDHIKIFTR